MNWKQKDSFNPQPSTRERFVLLGWCRTRGQRLNRVRQLAEEHHTPLHLWDFQQGGILFLVNTHPNSCVTPQAMLIQLGYAHSQDFRPLHAQDWLNQGRIGLNTLNLEGVQGNSLLLYVSQSEPAFSIYQSLLSVSQIYYWQDTEGCLFTDTLRLLPCLIDTLELNPDAVPSHMLFRTMPGEMTYFKNIFKLLPGHHAAFKDGQLTFKQVEKFDDFAQQPRVINSPQEILSRFNQIAEGVVASYRQALSKDQHKLAMLLSGGVDSTLIASLLKENAPKDQPLHSMSYAMREVPSFKPEIGYAQHAAELLNSQHTFFDIFPKDYPALLEEYTNLTATPIDNEQDGCYLVIVKHLADQAPYYLFSGSASDTLLGNESAKRLLQVESFKRLPGSGYWLQLLGKALSGIWPNKAYGLRDISSLLISLEDRLSPCHPLHKHTAMSNLKLASQCFPAHTLRSTLEYRLNLLDRFTSSQNLAEQVHLGALLKDVHDEEAAGLQAFRAHGIELIVPFLDSSFLQAALSLPPERRYYADGRSKWIPKRLLEMHLPSPTTNWPKRYGGFDRELFQWMKNGVLKEMVMAISRPAFMTPAQFSHKQQHPDWFTWNLLTLDLFQKRVLRSVTW